MTIDTAMTILLFVLISRKDFQYRCANIYRLHPEHRYDAPAAGENMHGMTGVGGGWGNRARKGFGGGRGRVRITCRRRFALVWGSSADLVSVGHRTSPARVVLSLSSLWRTGSSSYSATPHSTCNTCTATISSSPSILQCSHHVHIQSGLHP